jgi:hypothetical protein
MLLHQKLTKNINVNYCKTATYNRIGDLFANIKKVTE